MKPIVRQDGEEQWERIVMGEVLIPNVPNVFGDIYTEKAIIGFCNEFARQGFGIDVDHDRKDVTGKVYVVQSFIARPDDKDFIPGSWVVGMKIEDDDLWVDVLAGNIAGYSFEAECMMLPVQVQNLRNRQIQGTTEPDPIDGHTHDYLVIVNSFGRPLSGGTGTAQGHAHTISTHTVTDVSDNLLGFAHVHRYQTVLPDPVHEGMIDVEG